MLTVDISDLDEPCLAHLKALAKAPLGRKRSQPGVDYLLLQGLVRSFRGQVWLTVKGLEFVHGNVVNLDDALRTQEEGWSKKYDELKNDNSDWGVTKSKEILDAVWHAGRVRAFLSGEYNHEDITDAYRYALTLWEAAATGPGPTLAVTSIAAREAGDLANAMYNYF